METESQGGESDLPKVTLGMRSGTEMEMTEPAPCPESEKLFRILSRWGRGGPRSADLMHMQDSENSSPLSTVKGAGNGSPNYFHLQGLGCLSPGRALLKFGNKQEVVRKDIITKCSRKKAPCTTANGITYAYLTSTLAFCRVYI